MHKRAAWSSLSLSALQSRSSESRLPPGDTSNLFSDGLTILQGILCFVRRQHFLHTQLAMKTHGTKCNVTCMTSFTARKVQCCLMQKNELKYQKAKIWDLHIFKQLLLCHSDPACLAGAVCLSNSGCSSLSESVRVTRSNWTAASKEPWGCCTKSCLPVNSKLIEAQLSIQDPKVKNQLSLLLLWTRCCRDRRNLHRWLQAATATGAGRPFI